LVFSSTVLRRENGSEFPEVPGQCPPPVLASAWWYLGRRLSRRRNVTGGFRHMKRLCIDMGGTRFAIFGIQSQIIRFEIRSAALDHDKSMASLPS
jgi:hypothetical protein